MSIKLTNLQKEILELYIGRLIGLKEIGRIIKKDPRTFKRELIKLGVFIPSKGSLWTKVKKHANEQFFRTIPKYMNNILTGMLLGDANLEIQTKNLQAISTISRKQYLESLDKIKNIRDRIVNKGEINVTDIENWNKSVRILSNANTAKLRLHKSVLEIEWVKILANEFNNFVRIKTFVKPNKTKSTKWSCGFDTAATFQFFELWKFWYKIVNGAPIKKLPVFNKIEPDVLLHWYVDDGYFTKTELAISTQNFSLKEQKVLVKMLKDIGLHAKIREKRKAYYITLSSKKENINNFFGYLKEAKLYNEAKKCFPYKFLTDITKTEWKKQLKEKHPEYFDDNPALREKLLKKLNE